MHKPNKRNAQVGLSMSALMGLLRSIPMGILMSRLKPRSLKGPPSWVLIPMGQVPMGNFHQWILMGTHRYSILMGTQWVYLGINLIILLQPVTVPSDSHF